MKIEHRKLSDDAAVTSNVFTRQHRPSSVTYPDSRVIFNDHDTSNADYPANRLSRVLKLRESTQTPQFWDASTDVSMRVDA
jgi:hypothetical protein